MSVSNRDKFSIPTTNFELSRVYIRKYIIVSEKLLNVSRETLCLSNLVSIKKWK